MASARIVTDALPAPADPPDPRAMPGHLRHGAGISLLAWVLERPDLAEQRIAQGLRKDRRLGSKDRPWVADTLYGILRRRRLLQTLLAAGGWQGEQAPEALWWAWQVLVRRLPGDEAPVPSAWLRGCEDPGTVLEPWGKDREPWEWLATVGSLPDWLARGLLEDRDLEQALAEVLAQDSRAPVVLRVAAHRTTRKTVLEALHASGIQATAGRWSPLSIVIQGRVHLPSQPCWRDGLVSLQDEASQVVASLVAPDPHSQVVDACAGAGGKALAIAATAPPQVQVIAMDIRKHALVEARKRARREGLKIRTLPIQPEGPVPLQAGTAARVLVDAPCSGSGTLRRHPGLRWRWDEATALALPDLQVRLLERYADLVAPGGHLIYATCSLWRAENQGVVDRFLAAHPSWEPIPIIELIDNTEARDLGRDPVLTMTPHHHGTDGFFAAVLRAPKTV